MPFRRIIACTHFLNSNRLFIAYIYSSPIKIQYSIYAFTKLIDLYALPISFGVHHVSTVTYLNFLSLFPSMSSKNEDHSFSRELFVVKKDCDAKIAGFN